MRIARNEGLIQIRRGAIQTGMTVKPCCQVRSGVQQLRLLSQSYYILSWLSLRNDTGGWLASSFRSAGSYCMACYRATCNTPCILTKFPNAPWIYYSADPETLESQRKLKIRENFAAFGLVRKRERERESYL